MVNLVGLIPVIQLPKEGRSDIPALFKGQNEMCTVFESLHAWEPICGSSLSTQSNSETGIETVDFVEAIEWWGKITRKSMRPAEFVISFIYIGLQPS